MAVPLPFNDIIYEVMLWDATEIAQGEVVRHFGCNLKHPLDPLDFKIYLRNLFRTLHQTFYNDSKMERPAFSCHEERSRSSRVSLRRSAQPRARQQGMVVGSGETILDQDLNGLVLVQQRSEQELTLHH